MNVLRQSPASFRPRSSLWWRLCLRLPGLHLQLRISGMSSPCAAMYCLCSMQLVADGLLGVGGARAQLRHAVDDVGDQMKAVEVVQDDHVERRGGRAFFLVAAHVQIVMIGAAIGQAMDQPRIAVKGEDDRLVGREEDVEILVAQAVRDARSAAGASSDRRR